MLGWPPLISAAAATAAADDDDGEIYRDERYQPPLQLLSTEDRERWKWENEIVYVA